jgi:uncharacterized protein
MHLAGVWRYPVKSLAGEALRSAEVTADGVSGDRVIHVAGRNGPLTGRTRHPLLTVPATTGPDGVPRVAGHAWHSAEAAGLVRAAGGPDARLVDYRGPERFDVLNLLVATDGSVAEFGADLRRLRPNLLIGGVPADAERDWPGLALEIGDSEVGGPVVGIRSVRQRCIVTSIDPDTGDQDLDVCRHIRRRFDGHLALDCWVIRPGTVHIGDPVVLRSTAEQPSQVGGWIVGRPYLATVTSAT